MTDLMPEVTLPGAGLPASVAVDPLAPDDQAPYGYTQDRRTGVRRPKKTPGRPAKADVAPAEPGETPSLEQLKAKANGDRDPDRMPSAITRKGGKIPHDEPEVPPFRAGPIAKGMNRLYLKTGKLVRGFDPEVGAAMIEATKKETDDDVTVGEAWEELARTNPRIRKVLLKLISGGAWGQLFMAHAPIFLAVIMKPAIIKHIPFSKIIESLAEPEDDTPAGNGALPGGMTNGDVAQVMDLAKAQMAKMGLGDLPPGMMEQAMAMANGAASPPATTVRNQTRNTGPRARRRK